MDMDEETASENVALELLIHLKQQASSSSATLPLPPPPTSVPLGDAVGGLPSTSHSKANVTTSTCCNTSRKRKLSAMSDEDLSSGISLLLAKLSCLAPQLLSRFEGLRKSEQKEAEKDEEIRQLKEEVEKLKEIAKKNDKEVRRLEEVIVKHKKEASVLKRCLQDLQGQLKYKDRVLDKKVSKFNSMLAAERNRHLTEEQFWVENKRWSEERHSLVAEHLAKEQVWVEKIRSLEDLLEAEINFQSGKEQVWVKERQTLNDCIRSLQSRVEELLLDNQRLEA